MSEPTQPAPRPPSTDPHAPPPIPDDLLAPVKRPSIDPDRPRPPAIAGLGELAKSLSIGLDFLFMIAAGGALGWGIDWAAKVSPWGILVGLLVGFAWGTVRLLSRLNRDDPPAAKSPASKPPARS
jgi:ATP synthase protein I